MHDDVVFFLVLFVVDFNNVWIFGEVRRTRQRRKKNSKFWMNSFFLYSQMQWRTVKLFVAVVGFFFRAAFGDIDLIDVMA
jgi:hypothetical protein